jgi:hypothetical protein
MDASFALGVLGCNRRVSFISEAVLIYYEVDVMSVGAKTIFGPKNMD